MYSVTGAAKWELLAGQHKDVFGADAESGFFSQVLQSSMRGTHASGTGVQDMLAKLGERFPFADIREGEVKAGVKGMEEFFGDEAGDHVAVEASALESMFGDGSLAKAVEDAMAAFLENSGASSLEGAYVQRRVSITVTTVRFSVAQRDAESGELLSANELKTALHDKIQELVDKFFGKQGAASDESDGEETAADDAAGAADKTPAANAYGYGAALWSMELYYSASYVQAAGQGSAVAASAQSWQTSAAFTGNFSQFSGNFLAQALYTGFGAGGMTGPFTSLLGQTLSGFGMTSDGVVRGQDGYSLKLRQSRNLVAELMELFGSRVLGNAAADVGAVGETEDAGEASQSSAAGEAEAGGNAAEAAGVGDVGAA